MIDLDLDSPEPDDEDLDCDCDCDCHDYFDPDGLLCIDGYCDICGALGGGDETMPRHPDVACACGSDRPGRECCDSQETP